FLHNMLLMSTNKNLGLSNRIFCTSSKNIRSRVMTYLSSEAVKSGSMDIVIPFNRQQMADYLNLERSALSKELGKMRDEGILEFRKNRFRLFRLEE
ncbi:MAG: Crp/Fnr family transcriptional regulator, partial [Lentihominibacter sp.]